MKKISLILGMLVLIISCFGQKTTKQKTEDDIIIVDIPSNDYERENIAYPQKTMSSRTITIEIMDTISIKTNIYYYSPRMERKDYSYWQELGRGDNYLGTTFNNKATILIPDTCEQGAKLMFHLLGYELFDVAIRNIQNQTHISVQLPKIYTDTVILEKEKNYHTKRTYIKPIIRSKKENQKQIFYTDNTPLYRKNGERVQHSGYDITHYIRFSYYPELLNVYVKNDNFKEIYKELKRGKGCSVLIQVGADRIGKVVEVEGFSSKKKCIISSKICLG